MNEELKIIISAEIAKLKSGVEDAKKQVSSFQDQVKKASENVDSNFKKIGEKSTQALKTIATGVAAAGAALLGTSAATEEYRENMAKLSTAFEAAGSNAEVAKNTYNDLYRVLGESDQATEAANHLAKLTTEEQALSEWTTICQGVYATFGDSLPIEGLTEAANETAKVGTVTGTLADALNWAGVNEDAFNESLAACNTEAEREALIRETLIGLYDDAAAKYEANNAQVLAQRDAQAQLQETLAALGEAMAPVLTAFTSFANDALAVVTPYIQQLAMDLMPVLQSTLEGVASALEAAFTWASQHKELLAVIAGIITGIVVAIGLYNAVAAVKAAMDAAQVTTLGALISAYAAQAVACLAAIAPYLLIVAAIAAVIAIIVLCVKHWDEIKEKVKEVAENIANWVSEMKDKAVNKFNELKDKAAEKIENLKQAASDKFNSIKTGITDKINGAKTAVTEGFSNMVSSAKEKCSNIVSAVKEKFESVKSSIKEKIEGAKNIVKEGIDKLKSFFNFEWSLPNIKLPHFSISGSFSLNPPSIPKFSVSWYQLGGVFDKATLFPYGGSIGGLGENGAEAVVPLEKNTQWMDKLASMLSERMNIGQPIVLQVDGKTFAQISVDSINQLTRQVGSLPLKLV